MKKITVLFPLFIIAFIFTLSPAIQTAHAQAPVNVTYDFESGMPDVFSTLVPPPASCDGNSAKLTGPMERAMGDHGYGLHEGPADPAKGDTGYVTLIFPHLVDISVLAAHVYSPGAPYATGITIQYCAADGSSLGYWNKYAGDGLLSGSAANDVAAVIFEVYECEGLSGACTNMITVGEGGFHAFLDDISITYEDTGVSFNNNIYGQTNAGPFRPVATVDTTSIADTNHTVFTSRNANVHLILDGTIGSITRVTSGGSSWNVVVRVPGALNDTGAITYSHLQGINAEKGDFVNAGCVIGMASDDYTSG
jgi:hypothetical protein